MPAPQPPILDDADDARFMQLALREAARALDDDEVPVGCVIVAAGGRVIAKAH
ncbi:MAG TPA: hypothetical protein VHF22_08850, partial [Planctomycetota bacterium]|nr:hypothetical protein [Planctomycetota bacterium]